MAEALLGRRGELAEIERFLDSGVARALLIEGEPGIGKTSLWRRKLGVRVALAALVGFCLVGASAPVGLSPRETGPLRRGRRAP